MSGQPDITDALQKHMDKFAAVLSEYADAVQIHVTWTDADGDTHCLHRGLGNWHARRGMVHEFIERDQARTLSEVEHTEYPEDRDQQF